MKNIAVILAGGTGTRMGEEIPKQFISVMGKPIIQYSMETFENHPLIDEIIVVLPNEYVGKLDQFVDLNIFVYICTVINRRDLNLGLFY